MLFLLGCGLTFVVAVVMAARGTKKAVGATRVGTGIKGLAQQPGWRLHDLKAPRWQGHLAHFPWLTARTRASETASGPLTLTGPLTGKEATVSVLVKQLERDVDLWLAVCTKVAQPLPRATLERDWSSAAQHIRWPQGLVYGPRGQDTAALEEALLDGGLAERLVAVGAPAVSFLDAEVCLLWHPLPDGRTLGALTAAVAELLPDLVRAAADQDDLAEGPRGDGRADGPPQTPQA
ncbi:hypothetical protein [Kitasatospora sp. A2-31]|uniref:hypothetical protein n=1 Tax=Kitasatospora sp. A2-31 TaxID=2916414 RepID=UPI001EED4065|nr:hypothetical protein [Kitasatospora sp. A2-31]MCG6499631.1 hypothetical protein [Kitasatospora sp. A2-31]